MHEPIRDGNTVRWEEHRDLQPSSDVVSFYGSSLELENPAATSAASGITPRPACKVNRHLGRYIVREAADPNNRQDTTLTPAP
ncbi:Uncharacterised protein [Gordonia terrae]|nr:Uncharacterised protein [Gordonia terrae]